MSCNSSWKECLYCYPTNKCSTCPGGVDDIAVISAALSLPCGIKEDFPVSLNPSSRSSLSPLSHN